MYFIFIIFPISPNKILKKNIYTNSCKIDRTTKLSEHI